MSSGNLKPSKTVIASGSVVLTRIVAENLSPLRVYLPSYTPPKGSVPEIQPSFNSKVAISSASSLPTGDVIAEYPADHLPSISIKSEPHQEYFCFAATK